MSVLYLDKTLGILSSPSSCLYALLSTLTRSAPRGTHRRRARDTPATDRVAFPSSTPRTPSMSSAVALPARLAPRFRPADAPLRGAAARGSGTRLRARSSSAPRAAAPPRPDRPKAKVAVFVSGGGSNLRALHAAMLDGRVHAEVVAVVSNKPDCGGVSWAEDLGIPTLAYPPKKTDADGLTPDDLVHQLVDVHGAEYVCLAGYLRLIPPELCRAYERRMLNIHPALLPAFGGKGMHGHHVHEAVVASGARFSGPTVHFVNEKFDEGKILAQRVVPVRAGDSPEDVAARVLEQEHVAFAHALGALVDGRVVFREDGVPYIEGEDE